MIRGCPLDFPPKSEPRDFADSGMDVRVLSERLISNNTYYIEKLNPNLFVNVYLKNEIDGLRTGYLARVNKNLKRALISRGRVKRG